MDSLKRKDCICLDFDGVVHSYQLGWTGEIMPESPPVPGTAEAVAKLREKYLVKIYSTRCHLPGGLSGIKEYLAKHNITVDEICANKPPAIIYLDDRGIQFKGDWLQALNAIDTFTWWLEVKKNS